MSRRAQGERGPSTENAIAKLGGLLDAQHKYGDAQVLLAPLEAEARGAGTAYYKGPHARILRNLGVARTQLGQFAAAEADLLTARAAYMSNVLDAREMRKCAQAIVDLYDAWNRAEPGKGYAAKAAEWKRKLAAPESQASGAASH